MIKSYASVYEVVDIKRRDRQTDSSIYRPFFRALVVSCGLSTMTSKRSSTCGSRSAISCWRVSPSKVENFQISASSKSRNSSPGTSGSYTRIFSTLTGWLGNPRNYQLLEVRAHFSSCSKPWISVRPWKTLYLLFIQKCYRTDRPKSYRLWATGNMFPAIRPYIVRRDIWNEKTSFKHFPGKTEIETRDYF